MDWRKCEVLEARRKLSNIIMLSFRIGLTEEELIKLNTVRTLIKMKCVKDINYLRTVLTISVLSLITLMLFSTTTVIIAHNQKYASCVNHTPPPISQAT
uniref:Uncharacterized protein n=1 Tax=Rhodnius prolixus TaxID=13249 RepID=A0ABL0EJX7_RHOPR